MSGTGSHGLRAVRRSVMKNYPLVMRYAWARKLNWVVFEMALRGYGILNFENTRISGEAAFIGVALPSLLDSARPVFVDVGAHDGEFARLLLSHFPTAEVHALEPHPVTFARLRANMGDAVHSEALAFGDHDGTLEIWDYADADGSEHASMYRNVIAELRQEAAIKHVVDIATLDGWVAAHRLERIDLLKIDTEGAELPVLRGGAQTVSSRMVRVFQFEFNEMNVYSRAFFRDFVDVLAGYVLYRLLLDGLMRMHPYSPIFHEVFAFQNIVAIRDDLLPAEPLDWIRCR